MPCQQRAVARQLQLCQTGVKRGVGGGGSGWQMAEKRMTNQIHLPSSSPKSEKKEKILVAAHYVQILQIVG